MEVSTKIVYDDTFSSKQRNKSLRQLQQHKKVKNIHIILRILENPNLLHIIDGKELERMKKRALKIAVVGIAKNAENAVLLVQDIVEKMVHNHQNITGALLDEEFDIKWE